MTVLPPNVDPPDPSTSDTEFVHVIAQALAMPVPDRQELLERDSVLARGVRSSNGSTLADAAGGQ